MNIIDELLYNSVTTTLKKRLNWTIISVLRLEVDLVIRVFYQEIAV